MIRLNEVSVCSKFSLKIVLKFLYFMWKLYLVRKVKISKIIVVIF